MRLNDARLLSLFVLASSLLCQVAPQAGEGGERLSEKYAKAPSRAAIVKDAANESSAVTSWAQQLIAAKEKRALVELETIKAEVKKEQADIDKDEAERRRRQDRYDSTFGTIGPAGAGADRHTAVKVKLAFQVPEVNTYKLAAEISAARRDLAASIAAALGRMDRNDDGKLSGDEYRDAAAMQMESRGLFIALDANNDGVLAVEELVKAARIPKDSAAALRNGLNSVADTKTLRVKDYDKNNDNVLDVDERKALTMTFVNCSVQAGSEAVFYTSAAEALQAASVTAAAKYSAIEIQR